MMKRIGHFLNKFFWPEAAAIVGATDNPVKINYRLTQNLVNLNFEGKIYPVNPRGEETLGLKTYTSLKDIPDKVDLVVTVVLAEAS